MFGGPHPTYSTNLIDNDGVDAICVGEGDLSFPIVVEALESGEDFFETPNFWFKKEDGTIVKNPLGELVSDLDELPFPDREIMYEAEPALARRTTKFFMAMRGCPYKCSYCFNHAYNQMTTGKGKLFRCRSVDKVIEEVLQIKEKYPLDLVFIDDDTFLAKPSIWLEEFADKFHDAVGLRVGCNIRGELTTDKNAQLLKKIGVSLVFMGVECGDEELAKNLLKRNLTNEKLIAAADRLNQYKIKFITQNLIGLPVEDPLTADLKTLDFNIKLKPTYGWSSILYPYPGTSIGLVAAEKGMFDPNTDKIQVSNKSTSMLDFGDETVNRKIVNLHKLFGIIVQFPILRPATDFLISLPLTKLYSWIYFAFYGYKVVLRQSRLRDTLRVLWDYIPFYFRYVFNLEKRKGFKYMKKPTTIGYPSDSSAFRS